jgi:WD40 repeat protein
MCLYDIRTGKAERRIVMQMRSNSLSWCPTLPTVMLLASEDHNLYTFDIRKLETPTQVYKGHVAGVMSCDWSKSRHFPVWDVGIRRLTLVAFQVRRVRSLFQARMIGLFDYGTEMRVVREMFTIQNECRGKRNEGYLLICSR